MFKPSTDAKFLMITTLIVCALGAKTFASLTEADEAPSAKMVSGSAGVTVSSRSPSSVPTASEVKPQFSLFAQHDLNCNKKGSATILDIKGTFVQIQGRNCIKGFKTTSLEIVNLKNGFTASVFEMGSSRYQTDLIQLDQGENEIAIRYRERSGAMTEEVVKVRATKI